MSTAEDRAYRQDMRLIMRESYIHGSLKSALECVARRLEHRGETEWAAEIRSDIAYAEARGAEWAAELYPEVDG